MIKKVGEICVCSFSIGFIWVWAAWQQLWKAPLQAAQVSVAWCIFICIINLRSATLANNVGCHFGIVLSAVNVGPGVRVMWVAKMMTDIVGHYCRPTVTGCVLLAFLLLSLLYYTIAYDITLITYKQVNKINTNTNTKSAVIDKVH